MLLIMALLLTFILTGCGNEEESKGTITFGMSSWTSTKAPTEIAKIILEEAGFEIEERLLLLLD